MSASVASLEVEDSSATVAAGVKERAQLSFGVARNDDRVPADPGRHVVVGLGDLICEAEKNPGPFEDVSDLQIEDIRIAEHITMDREIAVTWSVVDQPPQGLYLHSLALMLALRASSV